MELMSSNFFQSPSTFDSNMEPQSEGNPFADAFTDPLCKLNLKETSDFVKSFPMGNNSLESRNLQASLQRRGEGVNSVTQRKALEAPSTPGRPIFSFIVRNPSRKSIPSKWDDAEKWLISSSCTDSPAHGLNPVECTKISKECDRVKQQIEIFAEKSWVTEEKVSKVVSSFHGSPFLDNHNSHGTFNGGSVVLLKDRCIDDVEPVLPTFRYLEPSEEGFLFKNTVNDGTGSTEEAGKEFIHEVKHRDVGTEMTPMGSSTTSRCHTPFKSTSPARHNTPANRSGPLAMTTAVAGNATINISQLQECHLAKLHIGSQYDSKASNWSSREEEEEEVSKSLRHFETGKECRRISVSDSRAAAWEEEVKSKSCSRYQREEAKVEAWVNLQNAKAEAQTRKLEVKIQKMRSNLEEKLIKRMAIVHRKAEERRAEAREQHAAQMQKARKILNRHAPTTGSVNTTTAEKQRLAFDCKNPTFRNIFPEYVEENNQQLSEQSLEFTQAENSSTILEKVKATGEDMRRKDGQPTTNKQQSFPTWLMVLLFSIFGVVMALPLFRP